MSCKDNMDMPGRPSSSFSIPKKIFTPLNPLANKIGNNIITIIHGININHLTKNDFLLILLACILLIASCIPAIGQT